jgi:hypothetical protein
MTGKINPIGLSLCLTVILSFGCGANETVLKSGKENAQPTSTASPKSAFESDMDGMQTAGFSFIYVLRRTDGGPIDAQDKTFIKAHTTDTNRRVASDEGKAILIGTNQPIPPIHLEALYGRFAVENHSPPPPANTNTNANQTK